MRCSELQGILETLGFDARSGSKEGHKVVTHRGLADFYSSSYTCGHGANPEVKPGYIKAILRLVKRYKDDLGKFMEDRSR